MLDYEKVMFVVFIAFLVCTFAYTIKAFVTQFIIYQKHRDLFDMCIEQRFPFTIISFNKAHTYLKEDTELAAKIPDKLKKSIRTIDQIDRISETIRWAIFIAIILSCSILYIHEYGFHIQDIIKFFQQISQVIRNTP